MGPTHCTLKMKARKMKVILSLTMAVIVHTISATAKNNTEPIIKHNFYDVLR